MAETLTFQPLEKKIKSYRILSYKKFHEWQNDRKGRYTRNVEIIAKKLKIKSQDPKKQKF